VAKSVVGAAAFWPAVAPFSGLIYVVP